MKISQDNIDISSARMELLFFKLLILGILILLIGLYLHIIITNNKQRDTFDDTPISIQLTNQIASKLGVSIRRIQNLSYTGDLSTQQIMVSFTILDPNVIENTNGEPNAQTAASNANSLFIRNNFIVKINGVNIRLTKTMQSGIPSATQNMEMYFNNTGLQEIADYSMQRYNKVPNDPDLTRFYNLQIDANYNIKPVLA